MTLPLLLRTLNRLTPLSDGWEGHLGFVAPLVDTVVLVGWYTDMHAHWLGKLISSGAVDPLRLVLVETAHPFAKSVARLVTRRVRLGDFVDVLPVVKDITEPPSDVEESDGLEAATMAAGPPPDLAVPVGRTSRSPSTSTRILLNAFLPAERIARPSVPIEAVPPEEGVTPRATTPSTRPISGSPQPPTPPVQEALRPPSLTAANVPPRPATAPAAPQHEETILGDDVNAMNSFIFKQPPAIPATPETAPEPTVTPPLAKPSKVALPRAPPVPAQYEPLLRILIALQGPSPAGIVPPPPLWSAVGNELQKSELKGRYGKLTAYMLAAQKDGWVVTGKGETEGSEWVKISQRGLRAMGKKPTR